MAEIDKCTPIVPLRVLQDNGAVQARTAEERGTCVECVIWYTNRCLGVFIIAVGNGKVPLIASPDIDPEASDHIRKHCPIING